MSAQDNGGPAFPEFKYVEPYQQMLPIGGMTIRDAFAIAALTAVPMEQGHLHDIPESYARIAQHAYKMADAMLEARK